MLFDRSWYNRAGVEHVMGFCTDAEYHEFLRSCPEFERMLVRSGIQVIKYWFSVSDEEQERRFQKRMKDPNAELEAQPDGRRVAFSLDRVFQGKRHDVRAHGHQAGTVVRRQSRREEVRTAELHHSLLSMIPYKDLTPTPPELPPRPTEGAYVRPPLEDQTFIPEIW